MTFTDAHKSSLSKADALFGYSILIFAAILFLFSGIQAQNPAQLSSDEKTLTIEDVGDTEVFAFGKTVIVKNRAKGVLALGGDVIIEGRIEGDVATIGGSVIQKENGFIGGDVIIFGGTYRYESREPLRNPGRETIMYAGYEEELREMMQNPSQIFAPELSVAFLAQRLLSVLFWFIASLAITTIAPGAVSRAVARFQLSTLKVVGLGTLGIFGITFAVILSLKFLPDFLGTIVSLMAFLTLLLAFVFGRVALQVSFGKWLQKRLLPENRHSESVALLIGSLVWAVLLSIPYVWTLAVFALFVASLGLVFTARANENWRRI